MSKSGEIWLSKSIFYIKNLPNLSDFFSFCYWHFLITTIFKSLYFLKWCPIFDSSPLLQFSKFNNFIWLQLIRFLAKNISNFVSLSWKLHNRYCRNDVALVGHFIVLLFQVRRNIETEPIWALFWQDFLVDAVSYHKFVPAPLYTTSKNCISWGPSILGSSFSVLNFGSCCPI